KNLIMVIALLAGTIIFFLYNRHRVTTKKEMEINTLKSRLTEKELGQAKKELKAFTEALKEKNRLIESMDAEFQKVQARPDNPGEMAELSSFTHMSILTEEDWQRFRQLFNDAYPGFFLRLKTRFPEITPSDI